MTKINYNELDGLSFEEAFEWLRNNKKHFPYKHGIQHRKGKIRLAEAQNWKCCYCHGVMFVNLNRHPKEFISRADRVTIEHIHKKCDGGEYEYFNLVAACGECNERRGNVDPYLYERIRTAMLDVWPACTKMNPRHTKRFKDMVYLATNQEYKNHTNES